MSGRAAIGVDVGGTKIAAGLVDLASGAVLARRRQATEPERGGQAVLDDVIALAASLAEGARQLGVQPSAVGVGLPELVGRQGAVLSAASFDWRTIGAADALAAALGLPVTLEADVRAAARAEARLGAGREHEVMLYVTVGTGISVCLVMGGRPYLGAQGLTGTFASSPGLIPSADGKLAAGPPLEAFASGPAIAARYSDAAGAGPVTAPDVIQRCRDGDPAAWQVVATAGEALGAAMSQLVNVLDPSAVVLGGGMGLVEGLFRESITSSFKAHVWSEFHRGVPLVSAQLGADAGFVGAALAAAAEV